MYLCVHVMCMSHAAIRSRYVDSIRTTLQDERLNEIKRMVSHISRPSYAVYPHYISFCIYALVRASQQRRPAQASALSDARFDSRVCGYTVCSGESHAHATASVSFFYSTAV